MRNLEPDALPHKRGINDRFVSNEDFIALFSDFLNTRSYANALGHQPGLPIVESEYTSNRMFWTESMAGHHFDGMRIRLRDFILLEWIPASPGRFFTPGAAEKREHATRYIRDDRDSLEYLPLGKEYMVLGGVGSLRLGSRPHGHDTIHVLGMSSTGVAHEGIPVALPDRTYSGVGAELRRRGAIKVDAIATLRSLPFRDWRTSRTREVPALFAFVDDLEIRGQADSTLATISILFPSSYHGRLGRQQFTGNGYTTGLEKSWSYASFSPSDGPDALKESVKWLEDYACRYSRLERPPIFADFDELHTHFESPIEFHLSEASRGTLDATRLLAYGDYYGVQINIQELRVGPTVEVDKMSMFDQRGQQVTYQYNAAGDINFERVKDRNKFSEELQKLLQEVSKARNAHALAEEEASDAGHQLDKAAIEAKKQNGDKSTLVGYLTGAKKIFEGAAAAGGLVEAVSKAIELAHRLF